MTEPKPVMIDDDGASWWDYLFSYDWEGVPYSFEICARSEREARERLRQLPLARFDGVAHGEAIKVSPQ